MHEHEISFPAEESPHVAFIPTGSVHVEDALMQKIFAGEVAWLTVEFFDKTGTAVAPTSATYTVYCATTSTEIRAATAMVVGTSMEIELEDSDTEMQSASNDVEVRKICVAATFAVGDVKNAIYRFEVVRPEDCS